ncbi:MAG: isochorismate synthase [Bacteriovorax sp.]|nr:isochorismate synthase [Bacteriovorax sp.]
MDAESFLKEELQKIDFSVSQKKSLFTFPEFSLVDLLPYAATEEVFYFESKEEDFSFLGLGKSKILNPDEVQAHIEKHPHEVLVYQSHFEDESPKLVYLPEWCFLKTSGVVTLKLYHSIDYKSYSPSNIIFDTQIWESFVNHWTSYEERPESDEWKMMVDQSLRLFTKKELEKIVLSRKKIFSYDEMIEMPVMFRELYQGNLSSSHFSIFHQLQYNLAFISFTPERLFTLRNKNLETISLAGSIMRGKDDAEDSALEETLKNSDKLTREHEIVTKAIEEKLSGISEKLMISELFTMKLPYIQHRQATIKAVLKKNTNVISLIDLLHPTPAVGGIPFEKARTRILEIEKEKRGFYAAPVGVISKEFSEIVVGIRSALIEGPMITVYGGAGIVAGSIAEEEWIETGTKMQPFIKIINKSVI